MARPIYSDGDRWQATDAQLAIDQGVMIFADAGARDAAIPAPTEGMHAYLTSDRTLYVARSGAWRLTLATAPITWPLVWSSTGVAQPALGDGAWSGVYTVAGGFVTCTARLTFGAGTSYGQGSWGFDVPVAARGGYSTPGTGAFFTKPSNAMRTVILRWSNSTRFRIYLEAATSAIAGENTNIFGTSGDLGFVLSYPLP